MNHFPPVKFLTRGLPFLGLVFLVSIIAVIILLCDCLRTDVYCHVTLSSVEFDPNDPKEWVTLRLEMTHSSGATVTFAGVVNGNRHIGGQLSGGSFPPMPSPARMTLKLELDRDDSGLTIADRARQALLVQIGQTYEVSPGRPLKLYSFRSRDGELHEKWVEVSR